jgi:integrase
MTYQNASRSPKNNEIHSAMPTTLADVVEVVRKAPQLSETARRDRGSALRTVARLTGRPLNTLACDVASVRATLAQIAPARFDLSPGRWTNIKSLVFRSLDLAQVPRFPSRSHTLLSDAWLRLLAPLPEYPFKLALRPFARYCSAQDITPEAVDQALVERYEAALENSARAEPRHTYLRLLRAWNAASEFCSDWPPFRARATSRRRDYALPWHTFPASFKADVDAMKAAAVKPDPFCPGSPKPIKRSTAERRAHILRVFASVLVHQGHDPKSIDSIAALLTLDRFQAALRFIHARIGHRETTHLRNFVNQVCVVAQHWVRVPDNELKRLKAIRRNVRGGAMGMTDKNRATLRVFKDGRVLDKFLSLPSRVWHRHRNLQELRISDAINLQLALAIDLLTHAPIRLGNLSAIRLGEHIIDHAAGRHRRVHLHFPAADVKNGIDLEFSLPASTVALLDRYVTQVRPMLEWQPSAYLFPGRGAGHKKGTLLSAQIASMVEREVGVRLTAHQFRHLAGFIYLKVHPGGHEVVRRLLGHKSIETTIRFYAGMEIEAAIGHYDAVVQQRRAESMRPTRSHRRARADA